MLSYTHEEDSLDSLAPSVMRDEFDFDVADLPVAHVEGGECNYVIFAHTLNKHDENIRNNHEPGVGVQYSSQHALRQSLELLRGDSETIRNPPLKVEGNSSVNYNSPAFNNFRPSMKLSSMDHLATPSELDRLNPTAHNGAGGKYESLISPVTIYRGYNTSAKILQLPPLCIPSFESFGKQRAGEDRSVVGENNVRPVLNVQMERIANYAAPETDTDDSDDFGVQDNRDVNHKDDDGYSGCDISERITINVSGMRYETQVTFNLFYYYGINYFIYL